MEDNNKKGKTLWVNGIMITKCKVCDKEIIKEKALLNSFNSLKNRLYYSPILIKIENL